MSSASFAATLRDSIAQRIREKILSGELEQDSKVDIDELAADFGSSRTPVREALIELSHQGLVEIIPRRGIRVTGMSPETIRDTFAVFGALSGLAAEWATKRANETLVARLREINEAFRAGADDGVDENLAFHREINRACGSPRLTALIAQLSSAMPSEIFRFFPEQSEVSVREHDQLIDAIAAGDAQRARALAQDHILAAGDRMIQRMEERSSAPSKEDH